MLLISHGERKKPAGTRSEKLIDKTGDRFFAYTRTDIYLLSNWFMISPASSLIAVMLRDVLYAYWAGAETSEHYFWFHYLFEALYNLHGGLRTRWDSRVMESAADAHTLQERYLFRPYDEEKMKEIRSLTHVQKLTYKISDPPEGSFWHALCREGSPVK